jgi:hypothetical protein
MQDNIILYLTQNSLVKTACDPGFNLAHPVSSSPEKQRVRIFSIETKFAYNFVVKRTRTIEKYEKSTTVFKAMTIYNKSRYSTS